MCNYFPPSMSTTSLISSVPPIYDNHYSPANLAKIKLSEKYRVRTLVLDLPGVSVLPTTY